MELDDATQIGLARDMLGQVWDAQRELLVRAMEAGSDPVPLPLPWAEVPGPYKEQFARLALPAIAHLNGAMVQICHAVKIANN